MAPEQPSAPAASVTEHRDRVLNLVAPLAARERLAVADASGRVLAEPAVAGASVPPFDQAAMDGFAVRTADVAAASDVAPVVLPVAAVVVAGDAAPELPKGAAIRIMTGAPLPVGADLVVPFEWTDAGGNHGARAAAVQIHRAANSGAHIRQAGEDVTVGDIALLPGTRLGPPRLGLLTSIAVPDVVVRARPRLAVLTTGAELTQVMGRTDASDGANRHGFSVELPHLPDSNTVTLLAAGRDAGADATAFGPAPDDVAAFLQQLAAAAESADLVVTTGGISLGDRDVVKAALADRPEFWFGPVALKPGRPQGCGVVRATDGRRVPVINLPGTPVAATAGFALFVVPALRALAGLPSRPCTATLATDVEGSDRTVLLPGVRIGGGQVTPLRGHAGHSQRLLSAADVLIVVPPTAKVVPAGTALEVLALHPEES